MNGWTEDKTVKAMVLLGEEIASQITPEQMVAVQMPEYSIVATVEFACRTELRRRGGRRIPRASPAWTARVRRNG